MAIRAHSTPIAGGRRHRPAIRIERATPPRRALAPASAPYAAGIDLGGYLPCPAHRARIAALVATLIDWLDATGSDPDLEPDADGEEEQDCCSVADDDPTPYAARQLHDATLIGSEDDQEASLQPLTLAMDWRAARQLRRGVARS